VCYPYLPYLPPTPYPLKKYGPKKHKNNDENRRKEGEKIFNFDEIRLN